MRRLIFLIVMMTAMNAEATRHWLAPGGTSTNDGAYNLGWHDVTLSNAFGTLQAYRNHTSSPPTAGDTLLILGGTYNDTQYFIGGTLSGTRNNPFVIKAAGRMRNGASGDGRAIFTGVSGTSGPAFFAWTPYAGDAEYCVIDGFSDYDPDSAYYIYIHPDTLVDKKGISLAAGGDEDGVESPRHLRNFTVRGIEFNYRSNRNTEYTPFVIAQCDSFVVDHVKSQWAGRCTGNSYLGHVCNPCPCPDGCDCSLAHTDGGCLLDAKSCSYGKITNSIFKWGQANQITISRIWQAGQNGHPSTGITVKNCIIEGHWGGGLYLHTGTTYCLVEDNMFLRTGENTTFPKEAFQLTANYTTVRGNIFHAPYNAPLSLEGLTAADGRVYDADYNYIYNNTMFEMGKRSLAVFLTQTGSAENNVFSNNILYKPIYGETERPPHYMGLWLNCLTWNTSTWGNCVFQNNCIAANRSGAQSLDYPYSVVLGDADYSVRYLQSNYAGHWSGNICEDPKIWSENPDTVFSYVSPDSVYGSWGWYKLKYDSPCIDKGTVIHDPNGEYVRTINANWGWYDLPYYGSAPDIGAYEYRRQSAAPPIAPLVDCLPGRR